jgi:hypothetical protein
MDGVPLMMSWSASLMHELAKGVWRSLIEHPELVDLGLA